MFFEPGEIPSIVFEIAQWMIALSILLTFIRILKGPSGLDRIVALDLLSAIILVQCVLFAIESKLPLYLDIAFVIAVIGFISTVAFTQFLKHRHD